MQLYDRAEIATWTGVPSNTNNVCNKNNKRDQNQKKKTDDKLNAFRKPNILLHSPPQIGNVRAIPESPISESADANWQTENRSTATDWSSRNKHSSPWQEFLLLLVLTVWIPGLRNFFSMVRIYLPCRYVTRNLSNFQLGKTNIKLISVSFFYFRRFRNKDWSFSRVT